MRKPREYQEGIYYITVKGNSREFLFREPADYQYFLDVVSLRKEKYNFKIYAYCLLPGSYYILIEASPAANISKIMQALNTSYALYYNKKYHHIGHIVSGRFEARLMNKDNSLSETIRRMHLNPLQLRLVKELKDYKWSSFPEYLRSNTSVSNNLSLRSAEGAEAISKNVIASPSARNDSYAGLTDTDFVKSFGYAPETDRDYAMSTHRHLSLFKKYYLVPVSALLIFLVVLYGQPTKMGTVQKIEPSPFARSRSYLSLPQGLPQPQLANGYETKQPWEIWNVQ